MQTYVVKEGDTLYGISKQFGIGVESIKKENNLLTNNITVGQVLRIPTTSTTVTYIVKRGDSLYSIAQKYGVSVGDIVTSNNLSSTNLAINQTLVIPVGVDQGSYTLYTVKVNETLYSIAKKFNTTVEDLKRINNIQGNTLGIGQILKIPSSDTTNYYVVQKGDSLYAISKKTGIPVATIKELNNLSSDLLTVGQVLVLSGNQQIGDNIQLGAVCFGSGYVEPKYLTYTVKKGDSLYSIAKKFDVSVDSIKRLNGLTNNFLDVGDVLKIKEVN